MVIDANMYWIPESLFSSQEVLARFVDEAPQDENTKVYLRDADGVRQVIVEKPAGYEALSYAQGDYVLEHMLADMDEAGVDIAVLKVPGANIDPVNGIDKGFIGLAVGGLIATVFAIAAVFVLGTKTDAEKAA